MSLSVGIIGLEGSGKSSLFQAVTRGVHSAGRSSMTAVAVPDSRLQILADMVHPRRVVPASVQFVDVGGLSRGVQASGGLGSQFLSNLQGVDALAIVLRCYTRPDIGLGPETADPIADAESVLLELTLSDLGRVHKRLERTSKAARGGDQAAKREEDLLFRLEARLDAGQPGRGVDTGAGNLENVKDLGLLTLKPIILVANVAEGDLGPGTDPNLPDPHGIREMLAGLQERAGTMGADLAILSAGTEAELTELPEEDAREYLLSLGVTQTGLDRFIHSAYSLLEWLTFFTAGEPEVRAWTVRQGARAPEAAGRIHSDIERGFIRAEVTSWDDLLEAGSPEAAKRAGKTRLEGKDYVMREGDVVYFRFNV